MTIGLDTCCSVLEPLQLYDVSGIATATNRAAVLEVRLNDSSIKSFHKCFREINFRKPIARAAFSLTDFI